MTTTYDMNDTATLAHDPYVSEYGDGYGGAYGTGYDTDHGSGHMVGDACDDGRAVGGTYGGGHGSADGYGTGYGTGGTYTGPGTCVSTTHDAGQGTTHATDTPDDAAKPSVGDRVDNALDGMRNVFDKVVGTTKEKLADGGWDRAAQEATTDTGTGDGDSITYNQIHEATPDPAASMDDNYGGSSATVSMSGTGILGGDKQTGGVGGGTGAATVTNANGSYANSMGTVSEDCGAISGRACGTRQAGDTAENVARAYHDINTATYGEDEI